MTGLGSLVSKVSNLLARLDNLASLAMDDLIDWRPPFEEMEFEFLEVLLVGSIGWFFQLDSHINLILHFHPFTRILLGTVSKRVLVE